MKKFKPKKNLLKDFIFNNEMKQASEQTVKSLLRSIVEPVIESNSEGVVLVRLFDTKGLDGLLKRLEFSKAGIYFYSDMGENVVNVAEEDIWEKTEFAIVLAPRYCAALVWDYSESEIEGYTNINFYLNTRRIQEILKLVIDNSRIDFMPDVEPYSLERRENELMCDALYKVVDCLNDAVLERHITAETGAVKVEKPACAELSDDVKKIIHEIRNNTAVVNLHARIIEKRAEKIESEETDKILKAKEVIEKASKTVNVLLEDLRCKCETKKQTLNVKDLAETVIELSEPKLLEKNINVETDLKNIDVSVDETRVLGVLLNIVNNAVYALNKNGKLMVKNAVNADGTVSLFVENNGEAIPDEFQEKIFEEGFSTKKADGGSGLGLGIAKASMKTMGGDLKLVSSGTGSTIFEIKMQEAEGGQK